MSQIFRFKQFNLNQEGCAMKMGTDAMLLGALAQPHDAQNILDIGTGTGVLSLMLAQRCPDAIIDAVEIDPTAAKCAKENFENSPWDYKLTIYNEPIQDYTNIDVILYEYIVCNPPYFEPSPTTRPDRVNARTTVALDHETLIHYADKLLGANGTLGLILPEQECERVINIAAQKNLQTKRQVYIRSYADGVVIRRVMEFCRENLLQQQEEYLHIYNEDKTWSNEYQLLTQDFHYIETR